MSINPTQFLSRPIAGDALPRSLRGYVGVEKVKWVTVHAVGFRAVHHRSTGTPSRKVFSISNWFKMDWIDTKTVRAIVPARTFTVTVVAQMIETQAFGDRTDQQFVREAMCSDWFMSDPEYPVSPPVLRRRPEPTVVGLVDLGPESWNGIGYRSWRWLTNGRKVPVLPPSLVMHRTPVAHVPGLLASFNRAGSVCHVGQPFLSGRSPGRSRVAGEFFRFNPSLLIFAG